MQDTDVDPVFLVRQTWAVELAGSGEPGAHATERVP